MSNRKTSSIGISEAAIVEGSRRSYYLRLAVNRKFLDRFDKAWKANGLYASRADAVRTALGIFLAGIEVKR